jgi:hypothetical protein
MNDPGVTGPGMPSAEAAADGNGAGRNRGPGVIVPAVTGLALSAVASAAASAVPGTFLKVAVWLAVAAIGLAVMSVIRTLAARRVSGAGDQVPPGPGR